MDEVLIKILGKAHVKKLHLRIRRPVGAAVDELLDTILNKASYTEIHLLLKLVSKLHQPQHLPQHRSVPATGPALTSMAPTSKGNSRATRPP